MTTDHEFAVVASTTDVQKVFVAIELSKSTWVMAIQPPAVDKVSLFRIAGGEIERCSNYLSRRGAAPVSPSRSAPAMRPARINSGLYEHFTYACQAGWRVMESGRFRASFSRGFLYAVGQAPLDAPSCPPAA